MQLPAMEHVKARNLARVRIRTADGKRKAIYLGPWGSEEAQRRYDEVIAHLVTSSRNVDRTTTSVAQLCLAYIGYAETYYVKDGEVTAEVTALRCALRVLLEVVGNLKVRDFSPSRLKLVRERMIELGWIRKSINKQVQRITRMLQWGVEEELVAPHIHAACKAVRSLARGRSKAVEGEPVRPVDPADIDAIEPFVSRQVWAMIQLQLETGMRPQEARTLRLADLDRSNGESWEYLPARHKTQHHGRQRRVYLNRRAQQIVLPFLKADPGAYLFSPADAYQESQERRRANRKTPMTPSQSRRNRAPVPRRSAGEVYSKDSYARAIQRGCELAFGMPKGLTSQEKNVWRKENSWSPNRLRHNAATTFEREFGRDVARAILGHSAATTTEIYVEEDFEKARRAMEARA